MTDKIEKERRGCIGKYILFWKSKYRLKQKIKSNTKLINYDNLWIKRKSRQLTPCC